MYSSFIRRTLGAAKDKNYPIVVSILYFFTPRLISTLITKMNYTSSNRNYTNTQAEAERFWHCNEGCREYREYFGRNGRDRAFGLIPMCRGCNELMAAPTLQDLWGCEECRRWTERIESERLAGKAPDCSFCSCVKPKSAPKCPTTKDWTYWKPKSSSWLSQLRRMFNLF